MKQNSIKIAIIQESPAYYDLEGSIEKASHLASEAADKGADLVVFGESWFTGYPAWLDSSPEAAYWDHEPVKNAFTTMYKNSIDLQDSQFRKLADIAKKNSVILATGFNEIVSSGPGQGTIYNSFMILDNNGKLIMHHRKLMPTYTERMVYGQGAGNDLKSADTAFGKVGGLICWEHWMPLARQAMHNSGEVIHIAVWPTVHEMHQIASRHYAFEGRCYVVAVGQIMMAEDIPEGIKLPEKRSGEDRMMVMNGGSCVIGPDGKYLLEPQFDQAGILYINIEDLDRVIGERMNLDTSGHYQRADVFEFNLRV